MNNKITSVYKIKLLLLFLFTFYSISLLGQRSSFLWPPYTSAETSIDLYNDFTFSAADKNEEVNDLYLEAKFNFYTYFTQHFYMFNSFNLEPVKDGEYGKSRAFEDIGLWWSNLNFNYETDKILIGVGRGSPNFSVGFAVAPGIWGSDDSFENLKTGGKWGVTVAPNISLGKFGGVSISASLFMADNTNLSDSYITRRGVFEREYGGPSNTGKLESYSLAIDGSNIIGIEDLFIHVAYMNQKVTHLSFDLENNIAKDSLANEKRFVASIFYNIELNNETVLTPFLEYGIIDNVMGLKGQMKSVFTASMEMNIKNWTHSLGYSGINNSFDDQNTDSDYTISATTSYLFNSGIEASIGYKYYNDNINQYAHTAGASLSFTLNSRNGVLIGSDFLKLNNKKQNIIIKRFVKTHKTILDDSSDDYLESLRKELINYINDHPNALNRSLRLSITNILLKNKS